MIYKRYKSPFETESVPMPEVFEPQRENKEECELPQNQEQNSRIGGTLDGIAYDDIIIIGLIIILLAEDKGKRDTSLILTLGFLFLIGYIDAD